MPKYWYEIFEAIRKKDPEHPVIFYTAFKELFEENMAKLHITEGEDPLLKIIRKNGSIKVKKNLIPSVEYFAQISIVRKLNRQLSLMTENLNKEILDKAMISLDKVPDKINKYSIALEESSGQKHTQELLFSSLKKFLHSKDVWDYFYEKGTEKSSILLLLEKLLTSVSYSDFTSEDLKLICTTLSILYLDANSETLNNTYHNLGELMRVKGVSIIPPIPDIDSLLKSYEDELWEEK
jgi:hypothetical protein